MVWLEASGRVPGVIGYPTTEIWTAKTTTSPVTANTTKRRLRTERWSYQSVVVGCGYAAMRSTPPGAIHEGLRIVRLSDGTSWPIAHMTDDVGALYVRDPVALTCDELIVTGFARSRPELVRLRLDMLGPGVPAD